MLEAVYPPTGGWFQPLTHRSKLNTFCVAAGILSTDNNIRQRDKINK